MLTKFKTAFKMFYIKIKPISSGAGFIGLFLMLSMLSYGLYDILGEDTEGGISKFAESTNCNVAGVTIHGDILTYIVRDPEGSPVEAYFDAVASEHVSYLIDKAENDTTVKAILIEIDSNGGHPVAAEEIANAIKYSTKLTVALIRETGVSAAYWAATGANRIFASASSNIGSIGVTSSYVDNTGKNRKDGNNYIQLSAGKFKDAGDPNKLFTAEERALFMRDLNILHDNFIKAVSENRNLTIERVRALADGSSMLGVRAKELGLIDQLGGIIEVEKYIEGIIGEKAEICWE